MPTATEYSDSELAAVGLDPQRLPRHIAVIMDGNGRWARERGLPRIEGHRRGVKSVRLMVEECSKFGIEQLTLYCLSSENWKRPEEELHLLMHLLEQYVIEERSEIMRQDLQFSIIGRRDGLGPGVLDEVEKTIQYSRHNQGMRLCLALNYGSRAELVDAVQAIAAKAARGELSPAEITEELISWHLYTAGMPDPDLVIRTAGEYRLSNFLLWQSSYSELWITNELWPDFDVEHLEQAVQAYVSRDRKYGAVLDGVSRENSPGSGGI